LRVLLPTSLPNDLPTAAIVNTGGGLVAGDRLDIAVDIGPGAAALVMAQAAEKVYRSTGATVRIATHITVARDGWLEWLPQETILFADSRLDRRLRIDLAEGARVMAGEIQVFGRLAGGERTRSGRLHDAIEVRQAGRLTWLDALHLDGDYGPILDSPSGFAGAAATATFVYAGPGAAGLLEAARAVLEATGVRSGTTCVNGVLVARWLAKEPRALRGAFGSFWTALRARAAGLPTRMPRLWDV
jgi:urease accessory protein